MGPELPDADKLNYLAGLGYKRGNWTIDVAYMYVDKQDRTVNNQTAPAPPSVGSGFNGTWPGTPSWWPWTSGTSSNRTAAGRGARVARAPFPVLFRL